MSKPKPGLGKGLVRHALSHTHPTPLAPTPSSASHGHGQHHGTAYAAVVQHGYQPASGYTTSYPPSSSRSGAQSSSVVKWRDPGSFASLGLPSPTSSSHEIVLPFRPSHPRLKRRGSGARAQANLSTLSSPSLGFGPESMHGPPPWSNLNLNANLNLLSSILADKAGFSLSSTLQFLSTPFADFLGNDAGFGTAPKDASPPAIPLTSPSASLRPPRPNEIHPALSPTSTAPTSSEILSGFPGFSSLGIPYLSPFEPFMPEPLLGESSSLNLYTSSFVFQFGASGLPKERPAFSPPPRNRSPAPPPRPRSFELPTVSIPASADIRSTSVGEDAYFTRMDGMCIADGVGGWARSGRGDADAGRWSRLLTHFCEQEVGQWWAGKEPYLIDSTSSSSNQSAASGGDEMKSSAFDRERDVQQRMESAMADEGPSGWASRAWRTRGARANTHSEEAKRRPLDPVEIMQRGYEKCLSCVMSEVSQLASTVQATMLNPCSQGIHGSSTCLLALLHHSTLLIANLGDCCLLLVRGGQIVFRTDEMQHAFNFPLQLGQLVLPSRTLKLTFFAGTHSRDEPMKDAKRYDVNVGRGDVVIIGSDGLMDNLVSSPYSVTAAFCRPEMSV